MRAGVCLHLGAFSCYRVTSMEVLGQSSADGNTSSLEVSGLTWLAVGVRRGAESPGPLWLILFHPRFPGTPYLLGVMDGQEVCIRADCPYVVRVMDLEAACRTLVPKLGGRRNETSGWYACPDQTTFCDDEDDGSVKRYTLAIFSAV